ncbi:trehalase-like domain-containing protein, partial [Streptomyces broussonetiae]|uniref:trehalase-like domain-containing protein n=1 Tax=Streptomyces broussonetiae TaxID=2686304 RepID=UPI0035D6809E
ALHDYALPADGERGELVGPDGALNWFCASTWHDEAIFASLIGGGGVYAVTGHDHWVPGGYYEEGTLIWRSRWITHNGVIGCREAPAFPGDADSLTLLRQVHAVDGTAHVRVVLDPRADFGRAPLTSPHRDDGVWHPNTAVTGCAGRVPSRTVRPEGLMADLLLKPGQRNDLVLESSHVPLSLTLPRAEQAWTATEHAWHATVPRLEHAVATRDARRAYALLRGLTTRDGGMVAAATTSLPERADEGPNYDYRYMGIRDQSYASQAAAAAAAAAAAGLPDLLDAAVRFTRERLLADGPHLAPGLHRPRHTRTRAARIRPARLSRRLSTGSATAWVSSSNWTASAKP